MLLICSVREKVHVPALVCRRPSQPRSCTQLSISESVIGHRGLGKLGSLGCSCARQCTCGTALLVTLRPQSTQSINSVHISQFRKCGRQVRMAGGSQVQRALLGTTVSEATYHPNGTDRICAARPIHCWLRGHVVVVCIKWFNMDTPQPTDWCASSQQAASRAKDSCAV